MHTSCHIHTLGHDDLIVLGVRMTEYPIENQTIESEHRRQKRNNFGVGKGVRTTLSFFVNNQIYVHVA